MRKALLAVGLVVASVAPTTASQATASTGPGNYSRYTFERLRIPMRDGVTLSASLHRPADASGQAITNTPVIVTISPYHILGKALDRTESDTGTTDPFVELMYRFVRRGYAYAAVDVRGTYNSGGCWDYGGLKERQDGYDVVEFFGTQPWSNGKVAMIGASYDGTTANAAAVEQPPHLATIVPISSISRWWGYAYQQGARATSSGDRADADPPSDTPTDFMFAYGMIPPPDADRIDDPQALTPRFTPCDRITQAYKGYVDPQMDGFWTERDYLRLADRVQVPVLVAHGLLDGNVKTWEGTAWFQSLAVEKMLILGQWPHALPAYNQWQPLLTRWFDRWLYGVANGIEDEPAVHVQGNTGVFRTQESWGDGPVLDIALTGRNRSFVDTGVMDETLIVGAVPEGDTWIQVPVATPSGVRLEGRARLDLVFSSDRPGTTFAAILCDVVVATGACTPVTRAFANARYRNGYEQAQGLGINEVERMTLEFIDTDHQLAPGHAFELRITSSSPTWIASDPLRALNRIYVSESVLHLPTR